MEKLSPGSKRPPPMVCDELDRPFKRLRLQDIGSACSEEREDSAARTIQSFSRRVKDTLGAKAIATLMLEQGVTTEGLLGMMPVGWETFNAEVKKPRRVEAARRFMHHICKRLEYLKIKNFVITGTVGGRVYLSAFVMAAHFPKLVEAAEIDSDAEKMYRYAKRLLPSADKLLLLLAEGKRCSEAFAGSAEKPNAFSFVDIVAQFLRFMKRWDCESSKRNLKRIEDSLKTLEALSNRTVHPLNNEMRARMEQQIVRLRQKRDDMIERSRTGAPAADFVAERERGEEGPVDAFAHLHKEIDGLKKIMTRVLCADLRVLCTDSRRLVYESTMSLDMLRRSTSYRVLPPGVEDQDDVVQNTIQCTFDGDYFEDKLVGRVAEAYDIFLVRIFEDMRKLIVDCKRGEPTTAILLCDLYDPATLGDSLYGAGKCLRMERISELVGGFFGCLSLTEPTFDASFDRETSRLKDECMGDLEAHAGAWAGDEETARVVCGVLHKLYRRCVEAGALDATCAISRVAGRVRPAAIKYEKSKFAEALERSGGSLVRTAEWVEGLRGTVLAQDSNIERLDVLKEAVFDTIWRLPPDGGRKGSKCAPPDWFPETMVMEFPRMSAIRRLTADYAQLSSVIGVAQEAIGRTVTNKGVAGSISHQVGSKILRMERGGPEYVERVVDAIVNGLKMYVSEAEAECERIGISDKVREVSHGQASEEDMRMTICIWRHRVLKGGELPNLRPGLAEIAEAIGRKTAVVRRMLGTHVQVHRERYFELLGIGAAPEPPVPMDLLDPATAFQF
mmetsp:Transcript_18334/g.44616  ORF Transcript_18334/g.44616 Transcript_18334/m.44616 type:complete len:787 (-) Transcript_18334:61-2421(-)